MHFLRKPIFEITFRPVQDMENLLQRGNGGVEGRDDVSEGELELALRGDELVDGSIA